jgi:hypothetical protein
VSKPGFDVLASLGKEQLIFDSDWQSTLLVLATGTTRFDTVPGPNGLGGTVYDVVVWPDQGFIPVFIPFISSTSPGVWQAPISNFRFRVKRTGVDYIQNRDYPGWGQIYLQFIALRAPEGGVYG